MAVLDTGKIYVLDDSVPLYCTLQGTENVQSHTEFLVRVQRGETKENSWMIRKRYSDFASLVESLKISGIDLPLPPKKLIGNMEREFIAERQRGLQHLIDTILSHPLLAASEIVKKFLDINNYSLNINESALQNVSMFFRSEPHWEVVEPVKEIGWRLRKSFFLIKPKDQPKKRLLLSWTVHGADKLLSEKDISAVFKLLPNLQTKPTKASFLKKYSSPKTVTTFAPSEIRQIGRQILEMLKFLHEKGLACHHLHTGGVLESILSPEACKQGVPSLEGLLMHPFFVEEVVVTVGIKPQLKIPSKLKETLKQFKENQEKRLREEQKSISLSRRLMKAKAYHSSDEERRRRKLEARRRSKKQESGSKEEKTSATAATNDADDQRENKLPAATVSPPPAAPPVPTIPETDEWADDENASSKPAASSERGALLSSIQGFNKSALKKMNS